MTDQRFLELHQLYITRHYRAALYLLGDEVTAACAAESSWLTCCAHQPDSLSNIDFVQALSAALVAQCTLLAEQTSFRPEALLPKGKPGNLAACQAIGSLPLPQRMALVLNSLLGQSPREIASLLHCSQTQAEHLLSTAREQVFGACVSV